MNGIKSGRVKEEAMFQIFLRDKPVKIALSLKKTKKRRYASQIAKEADCTYSHTVRVLSEMEERGLIDFNKDGRLKLIELSPYGDEIVDTLDQLVKLLKQAEEYSASKLVKA